MIKNFENFVNESFIENVLDGIDAGIGAFKASRNAEKAADEELKNILNGYDGEISNKVKMTVLVKQLVERSALLADRFSYETIEQGGVDGNNIELDRMELRIERIEQIISEFKELLRKDFNAEF